MLERPLSEKIEKLFPQLASASIPEVFKAIKEKCSVLVPDVTTQTAPLYPDPTASPSAVRPEVTANSEFCSRANLVKVRSEAIMAFRSPEKSEVRTRFLNTYLPRLKELDNGSYVSTAYHSDNAEVDELRGQISSFRRVINYQNCIILENFARDIFPVLQMDFQANIESTKVAHDYLLDRIYTAEQKQVVSSLIEFTKRSLVNFLDRNFGDKPEYAERLEKIRSEYANIRLLWPEKLGAEYYKKVEGFPLPVLDTEKIPLNDEFWRSLVGSQLESFTTFNAYYHPFMKLGTSESSEAFTVQPGFLNFAKDDPRAFLEVIGHELGHKIGWSVSQMNGHDMRAAWEPVVDCLSEPDSIQLVKDRQEDESLADWLAGTVVADYLETLPPTERAAFFVKTVSAYCMFSGSDLGFTRSVFNYGHPETSERLNGILAANRRIRSLIGCADDAQPYRYRICELPQGGSQTPVTSTGVSIPLNFRKVQK